jgi:hypothetical protein
LRQEIIKPYLQSAGAYPAVPIQSKQESLALVDLDAALFEGGDNETFIILEVDLPVAVEVGHGHPTVDILLRRVVVHPHHAVGLPDQLRNFVLAEEPALVLVELLEEAFGDLEAFSDVFGVGSG